MHKEDKERLVNELTERLKRSQTLIVADYRGLTNAEIDGLRGVLLEQGARFSVVKNTLTRRAAEAAGADALLALLEGPTAIAFLESGGDPAAVAKALADTAKTTRVLAIKGGLLEGRPMSAEEVEALAKLPPAEVVRAQLLGAITAPLTTIVALFNAPLQNLVGLIDARIEQLEAQGDTSAADTVEVSGSEPQTREAVSETDEAPAEPMENSAESETEEGAEGDSDKEPQTLEASVEAEAPTTDETESGEDATASE
ncbi:MAG: 50S ribosomal protein L10, partial [Actinomycetota bacterium]|nr:50S ribosomal protein L10 [Actinomycetota bacterium]